MNSQQAQSKNELIESLVDYSNKSTIKRGYCGNPAITLLASVGNYTWARLCREVQLVW